MKVYIINGEWSYEGGSMIAVYTNKKRALARLAELDAHKRKEPKIPMVDVYDPANDVLFDEHRKKEDAWRVGLNGESNYDYYAMAEIEVSK